MHGNLSRCIVFLLETFLGKLKKLVCQHQNPVQQLFRQTHEKQKTESPMTTSVFRSTFLDHWQIQLQHGNDCLSVWGMTLIVRNILSHSVAVTCGGIGWSKTGFVATQDWIHGIATPGLVYYLFVFVGFFLFFVLNINLCFYTCICFSLSMLPFTIVDFINGWGLVAIPTKWFIGPEEDKCYWSAARMNMVKAVAEQQDPHTDWVTCKLIPKRKTGTVSMCINFWYYLTWWVHCWFGLNLL